MPCSKSSPRRREVLSGIGLYDDQTHSKSITSSPNSRTSNHLHHQRNGLYPPTPPPERPRDLGLPPLSSMGGMVDSWRNSQNTLLVEGVTESGSRASSPKLAYDCRKHLSRAKLVDLASKLTCLFWFESTFVVHRVAESPQIDVREILSPHSTPTPEFKKWVESVISTTQVTQSVVMLALLFIFRLKSLNPTVTGKPGSESRLLTVALMLANKYLDDNTYTNKTWADVSRITVKDIFVMEIEFLSNMKFNLFTSEAQWSDWQGKINKFSKYWEMARERQANSLMLSGPAMSGMPMPSVSNLPSPPLTDSLHSTPTSPVSYTDMATSDYRQTPASSQGSIASNGLASRKRAREDSSTSDLPAKRFANSHHNLSVPSLSSLPPLQLEPPVVPTTRSYTPSHLAYLPPAPILPSNGPSMSSYFSQPLRTQEYRMTLPATTAPMTHNIQIPALVPITVSMPSTSTMAPLPVITTHTTPSTPQSQSRQNSPYNFYARVSPYHPVRYINTLCIPPPSPLHPYSGSQQDFTYNTLSKNPGRVHSGVVPYSQQDFFWTAPPGIY